METNIKQIEWAIKQWKQYVDNEYYLPAKNTGLLVVKSLELELQHGEPYCVCHLMKLKDCPNRYKY